jgi:hypothetical protein
MGYHLSRIWSWLKNQIVGYNKWKRGDNMNILKLQKCFIWLLFFNNLRKRTSHNFFENFWMKTEAHLISSQSYRTRLFIPRTRIRGLSCKNRRHSSTFALVNSAIFWHCGLRWFTVNHWDILLWSYPMCCQTKDYRNGICFFSTKYEILRTNDRGLPIDHCTFWSI